tara:strand:+ start:13899 stop:14933 length:1035 start_codon:yes stop_codon:yes gene_type:complete
MSDKSPEFAVFNIEGGIGKHICSTAVVKAYKNNHPTTKVIVVCAWPEIYLGNKDIERVYRLGNVPYFYEDYIYAKDTVVFSQEPYKETSHIKKQKHLILTWCKMIGIDYKGEAPNLPMNMREANYIDPELSKIQKTKPILLFQPFGGPGKDHQADNYSWTRDIHPEVAQHLVDKLKDHYQIIHVCYDFHHNLNGVIRYEKVVPKKTLFNMIQIADRCLFVDSSFQHAAAAMKKSATVVWVGTQPELFGYDLHTNIKAPVQFPEGTIDSYLYDYNFTGAGHECPYQDVNQMFDVDSILKSLLQPSKTTDKSNTSVPQFKARPDVKNTFGVAKRAANKKNRKKTNK